MSLHIKCRFPNAYVFRSGNETLRVERVEVPDHLVPWQTPFDGYHPTDFTAPHLAHAPWADPVIGADDNFKPIWNAMDGKINRKSHEGTYKVLDGLPLNIRGRTGLRGRGVLGRYGPNHAADPVVTRWKRTAKGEMVRDPETGKAVLQFVAVQRKDNDEWAIPGGMVDPGEQVSQTVKREFMEEALDSMARTDSEAESMGKMVGDFFEKGSEIYAGYVDDPRNTDNAWMETVVFLFHDETGDAVGKFDLKAGDDAKALKWMDISHDLKLYASHADFLRKAVSALV